MNIKPILLSLLVLLAAPCLAGAGTIMTFEPDPPDMNGLDHQWVYEWGIDVTLPPGEHAIEAELTFYGIYNWDDSYNVLYVHLLDWSELGLQQYYDNQGGGDYFVTEYPREELTHLVTYENIPAWPPQDRTYTFTEDDLAALNDYLMDEEERTGRIGLGLDPDCHFYNERIELKIVTPEPASLAFLGLGGLALLRRRRFAVP